MPKFKVLIEVDSEVWEIVPQVARSLELPSDAQTANVASMIFDALVWEAYMSAKEPMGGVSPEDQDLNSAVESILDPNVSVPLSIRTITHLAGENVGLTLLEFFDQYIDGLADDEFVARVKEKTEDPLAWKMAIATVYQVIRGDERRLPTTWALIERTYSMLKKGLDIESKRGNNGSVAPATKQPSKPQKE